MLFLQRGVFSAIFQFFDAGTVLGSLSRSLKSCFSSSAPDFQRSGLDAETSISHIYVNVVQKDWDRCCVGVAAACRILCYQCCQVRRLTGSAAPALYDGLKDSSTRRKQGTWPPRLAHLGLVYFFQRRTLDPGCVFNDKFANPATPPKWIDPISAVVYSNTNRPIVRSRVPR